jgi:hypothetical protein
MVETSVWVKQQRRDIFTRLKQGVVALAHLRTDLKTLQSMPGRKFYEHLNVRGTAFVVDEAGIAVTAHHVVEKHFAAVGKAKRDNAPPPAPLYWVAHRRTWGIHRMGRSSCS